MNSSIAEQVCAEFQVVEGDRGTFESHWREVAERVLPSYSKFFDSQGAELTKGEKRTEFQFDSTAAVGLGRFSAVVDSFLTPANRKWSPLKVSNPELRKDRDVKLYFENLTDVLHRYRYAPKANFQSQNHEAFRMLGAFGTGTVMVDRQHGAPGLRYKAIHTGELFFKENHQGIIDTAFRRYRFTARQISQAWPEWAENDEAISAALKVPSKANQTFQIVHCVKPRVDVQRHRKGYEGMEFASYYILRETKQLMEESGYRTWPFPSSRYYTVPGEVYGRSPAMDVLPAIKTLNEQKKTSLKQGHRLVDPILLLHDDGIMDGASMVPGTGISGAVTKEGRPLIHTLPVGNPMAGREFMEDERKVINDAFLVNLFQILTENPQMTATEVIENTKEKGILLNPTVGRQQSEYLDVLVEREISVLAAQNLLPTPPQILLEAEGEYDIEYDSPMARAAKAEQAAGGMRAMEQTLAIVSATGDPAPLDNYDLDVMVPEASEIHGMPMRWMRSPGERDKIRKDRADQAQQQQMVEAAPSIASMSKGQ
jgi:hypothetical protein